MPILLFAVMVFWLGHPPAVHAYDFTVTCSSGSDCDLTPSGPMFFAANISPGFSQSKSLYFRNRRQETCHLKLSLDSDQNPSLNSHLWLSIDTYQYNLSDLLRTRQLITLGHVTKSTNAAYVLGLKLDNDSPNQAQDQTTNFDLNLNFQCDSESSDPSGTASSEPHPTPFSPDCNLAAPLAPTNLTATRQADGDINLRWDHSISDHTGYLIAYGVQPNRYLYGAPDVGNVSSFTVQNLTYGAQYCFYIRSLNGCMPGERTPEYCVNSQSQIVPAPLPASGFVPDILGTSTQVDAGTVTPLVLGANSEYCPWCLFLVFIILICILRTASNFTKKHRSTILKS